MLVCDYVEQDS